MDCYVTLVAFPAFGVLSAHSSGPIPVSHGQHTAGIDTYRVRPFLHSFASASKWRLMSTYACCTQLHLRHATWSLIVGIQLVQVHALSRLYVLVYVKNLGHLRYCILAEMERGGGVWGGGKRHSMAADASPGIVNDNYPSVAQLEISY